MIKCIYNFFFLNKIKVKDEKKFYLLAVNKKLSS